MNQYQTNRNNLFKLLEDKSMILLSSGQLKNKTTDQFYPFQVNKTFFYLTGIREDNCTLMMLKDGEGYSSYLFIEETTDFMRQWVGEKISKTEASDISNIPATNILFNKSFDSSIRKLMSVFRGKKNAIPENLYLDLFRPSKDDNPVCYLQFETLINQYKELSIKNLNTQTNYLRMYKNESEINKLKSAIDITELGLNRIMRELKNRSNEHQIEADFVHEITLNGAEDVGFDTILASGRNACVLHYEDNNSPLNKGDLLLCDLGAIKNEYSADISRTYPVNGVYSKRQKEIYEIVLNCNKKCIEFIKEGITLNDVHNYSRKLLADDCIKIGLIKNEKEISQYYYHSIGHLLGLDVHDVGVSNVPLKAGMVLTIEPGLYIKEESIGIRIEDNILVTTEGHINLSSNIIKEVSDIEKYIKENNVT